jgi:hypothetical protein
MQVEISLPGIRFELVVIMLYNLIIGKETCPPILIPNHTSRFTKIIQFKIKPVVKKYDAVGGKTKAEIRETKRKIKMKVSGKSVLKLKRIIDNKK